MLTDSLFKQLPPLKTLKGFESAARNQSLRAAAEELNLTHPAISHQIKTLEAQLGVKLFERAGRNIILSEDGQTFYPYVRDALAILVEGVEAINRKKSSTPLRVQTYVTLSIRWLARRLASFSSDHAGINLQLTSCDVNWAFDEANADIGVVYCESTPASHLYWQPLFDYRLFPVCSPKLIEHYDGLTPRDLLNLPLLSVYTEVNHWESWFRSAGVELETITPHLVVDTEAISLEMALGGEGISLVNGPFANEDLESGRLVRPVNHETVFPGGWGAICRKDLCNDPHVKSFISWLCESSDQTHRLSS